MDKTMWVTLKGAVAGGIVSLVVQTLNTKDYSSAGSLLLNVMFGVLCMGFFAIDEALKTLNKKDK